MRAQDPKKRLRETNDAVVGDIRRELLASVGDILIWCEPGHKVIVSWRFADE